MPSQSGAKSAAIDMARGRPCIFNWAIRGAFVALLVGGSGCTPATVRVADADPADPAARTAAVSYRSTIAPYTPLRPATPAPWRERNESVTPKQGNRP